MLVTHQTNSNISCKRICITYFLLFCILLCTKSIKYYPCLKGNNKYVCLFLHRVSLYKFWEMTHRPVCLLKMNLLMPCCWRCVTFHLLWKLWCVHVCSCPPPPQQNCSFPRNTNKKVSEWQVGHLDQGPARLNIDLPDEPFTRHTAITFSLSPVLSTDTDWLFRANKKTNNVDKPLPEQQTRCDTQLNVTWLLAQ